MEYNQIEDPKNPGRCKNRPKKNLNLYRTLLLLNIMRVATVMLYITKQDRTRLTQKYVTALNVKSYMARRCSGL